MSGGAVAIAGAAGGLGPAVARALAPLDARLSLGERNAARLQETIDDLALPEDRVLGLTVDLLDPASAQSWVDATVERFGRVDALVHLVGGWRGGKPIAEAPPEDDDFLHAVLVKSVQVASRAFLPQLAANRGRFVIVSSPMAERPTSTNAAYGAAKRPRRPGRSRWPTSSAPAAELRTSSA